jgi:hypothetical protein
MGWPLLAGIIYTVLQLVIRHTQGNNLLFSVLKNKALLAELISTVLQFMNHIFIEISSSSQNMNNIYTSFTDNWGHVVA